MQHNKYYVMNVRKYDEGIISYCSFAQSVDFFPLLAHFCVCYFIWPTRFVLWSLSCSCSFLSPFVSKGHFWDILMLLCPFRFSATWYFYGIFIQTPICYIWMRSFLLHAVKKNGVKWIKSKEGLTLSFWPGGLIPPPLFYGLNHHKPGCCPAL